MKRQEQGHQDSQAISKEELPTEAYQSILQDIRAREAFLYARRSLKDTAKPEEQMEMRGADKATKRSHIGARGATRGTTYVYVISKPKKRSRWRQEEHTEPSEELHEQTKQVEQSKYMPCICI